MAEEDLAEAEEIDFQLNRFKVYGLLFGARSVNNASTETSSASTSSSASASSSASPSSSSSLSTSSEPTRRQEDGGKSVQKHATKQRFKTPHAPPPSLPSESSNAQNSTSSANIPSSTKTTAVPEKVLRVWYENELYKTIALSSDMTAYDVCVAGAKKLGLSETPFFFLFIIVNDQDLFKVSPDDYPMTYVRKYATAGIRLRFAFMNPPHNANLRVRAKTFSTWINYKLSAKGIQVSDLAEDLQSGVVLVELAQTLTKTELPSKKKFSLNPKNAKQMEHNCSAALELLSSHGYRFPSHGISKLIVAKNDNCVFLTLWSIFFHYHVSMLPIREFSEFIFFEQLRDWCVRKLRPYSSEVQVRDFNQSWISGRAFCALLEANGRHILDYRAKVGKSAVENLALAFRMALKHCSVPVLLDPEDFLRMSQDYDDLSIVMYLSILFCHFEQAAEEKRQRNSIIKLGSAPQTAQSNKPVVMRVFFEGFKNMEFKTLAFTKGISAADAKQVISQKTKLDVDSLEVFEVIDGEEFLLDDEDHMCEESVMNDADAYSVMVRKRDKKKKKTKKKPKKAAKSSQTEQPTKGRSKIKAFVRPPQ